MTTLQIIALNHDSQNPKSPMLPKAQKQHREFFGKMIREVNDKREGYEKESALQQILFAWSHGEKRIHSARDEIAKRAAGVTEKHIQLRGNPYYHSFRDFDNPFYREPMVWD